MTNTDNLNLEQLQQLMLASPDDDELRELFRKLMARWSHLEDCLAEETPD